MEDCLGDETIAAYVDGALERDAILRIDHHIDACASCRTQLSAVAASPVMHSFVIDARGSAATGELSDAIVHGQPGDAIADVAIGRYVVERVIARGGMGVVVRARDPELERAVAIKLVDPAVEQASLGSSSGEWRARLRAEARAMARLRHPNVVTVYDAGAVGTQLFVAMELVDGESLARHLARDRRDAIALCLAAGRGLCAAHAAGLVHGDIKPDNILVDRDGRALIGDFGLTRAIAECARSDRRLLIGTPAYMAPELLRRRPADPRSDVFAFAVTIYEAVAGRRPWRADTLDALLHAIEHAAPARPAAMSRSVWRVVAHGLAAERDARPASMAAFVDALERAHRPARRRRAWRVGGGAGAIVVAAIAIAVVATRGAAVATCADPIDRARALTSATLCTATPTAPCAALTAALATRAAAWRRTHVEVCRATRDGRQSAELLDRRMQCLDQRAVDDAALIDRLASPVANADAFAAITALGRRESPETCATFDHPIAAGAAGAAGAAVPPAQALAIADAARWVAAARADDELGHYRAGRDALAPHLAAIRALAHPPLLAAAATVLGELQLQVGDLDGAEASFDLGLAAAAEAGDDAATATLLLDRAHLLGDARRQWSRGAELLRAADSAVVRAGRPPRLEAALLLEQGGMAEDTGDLDAAHARYARALELRRAAAGPAGSIDVAIALERLCAAEHAQGKLVDARAHCDDALRMMRAVLGDPHPLIAEAEIDLAIAIAVGGDLAGARRHWEAALATLERGLGDDAPALAAVLLDLEDAARGMGDRAAADAYLARALAVSANAATGADDLDVQIRIADQLRTSGKPADGLRLLVEIARRADATLGPHHPTTAHALEALGTAYYVDGRYADARATYATAIAAATALYGERHPTTLGLAGRYGQAMMMMHDAAAAQPVFERALLALAATVPADSPLLAQAYTNVADGRTALGDAAHAIEPATRGLAIRERGDNALQTAEARFVLAQAMWRARHDPAAVAIAQRARDDMRAIGPRATSLPDVERWLAGAR